jgi:hypothetical protein
MTVLDWYGLAGLVAIALGFYLVRRIPLYILTCVAVTLAFGWVTREFLASAPAQWIVMLTGLCLASFGLLIVRVMLIRSVSLNLLRRLQASLDDEFARDIGSRLADMRGFGLVRDVADRRVELTGRGRFIAAVVGLLYMAFRIQE